MHRHLSYRPHIDGLRAVAVLGVVLSHFDLAWLPGGFVGVDVFFVISGFLISKSIYSEVETGEFSLKAFYERRARRILPAFFVVSAVTAGLACLLLLPIDLVPFAKSLAAAALFVSNIYFYLTSDYFGPNAIQLPLLHYWSLGVEEQFYILFPVIVMAAAKLSKRAVAVAVLVLLAASLGASEAMLEVDPAAAFYLLPFRAFEILIGSALALPGVRFSANPWVSGTAVAGGIAAIVSSMAASLPQADFPGLAALTPCLGAALVIWGGERISTLPARLLGSAPVSLIGKMSYSLYLVHWPVAVFGSALGLRDNATAHLFGGLALSLALAWLSYRFVETPFRQRRLLRMQKPLFAASMSAAVALLVFSGPIVTADGFPGRMDAEVDRVLRYVFYKREALYRTGTCHIGPTQDPRKYDAETCLIRSHPNIVLWGDSTIAHLYWGLNEALASRGIHVGQMTAADCRPLVGIEVPGAPTCLPFNRLALETMKEMKPDIVVLGVTTPGRRDLKSVDRTIEALQAAGVKVVAFGPVAAFSERVPVILARRMMAGNDNLLLEKEMQREVPIFARLVQEHFSNKDSVRYIPVVDVVCPDGKCLAMKDSVPLYWDRRHLTKEGSVYVGALLADAMRDDLAALSAAAAR